jgi:hypothetical protein
LSSRGWLQKKGLERIRNYRKDKKWHDVAIQRNKDKNSLMEWDVNDLKTILKLEKHKDNCEIPEMKREIFICMSGDVWPQKGQMKSFKHLYVQSIRLK